MMGCGRKHYIIVTDDDNLLVWGNVLKDKSELNSEGFHLHYGEQLFDGGSIKDI